MLLLQFLYNKKDHEKGGLFKMRKVGIVGKNKLFSRRKLKNCVIHYLKTMRKVGKIKCGWIARERINLNHNYIITEPLNIIQYF